MKTPRETRTGIQYCLLPSRNSQALHVNLKAPANQKWLVALLAALSYGEELSLVGECFTIHRIDLPIPLVPIVP